MGAHKEPQRTGFGTFHFEKQTTVRNEIVFIILKYLSGYMSHCERGFMKRKHTEKFVTVHIFASPRTVLLWTGCLHISVFFPVC